MTLEEYGRQGPRYNSGGCEIRETISPAQEAYRGLVKAAADGRLSKADPVNTAAWIARRAALIVEGDRAAKHGPKERNHQNIADHWNAYLGDRLKTPLRALDVALMMVELKIARTKAGAGAENADNYVDMAGYAACAGEIALKPSSR